MNCVHWQKINKPGWGICQNCLPVRNELQERAVMFTSGSCAFKTKDKFGCNQFKEKKQNSMNNQKNCQSCKWWSEYKNVKNEGMCLMSKSGHSQMYSGCGLRTAHDFGCILHMEKSLTTNTTTDEKHTGQNENRKA